ncbi:hypothetical protein [Sphingomonas sp. SUN039]|uniref:hypothetical protein n=1 Tax=Sphingomonas sp. SUN039 TaxID=2937787 RepID=UPI002164D422|nr:hypothetical protein [Sphingomonas sp. SUN039]UVO55037.1 hypothetical protein M0209_13185 [Sphingomonas sp. SUN039]
MKLLLPSLIAGDQAPAMPFYLLAGFAVELAFKAVILRSGRDESVLRKAGHRLDDCYKLAQESGFQPTDRESTDRLVAGLSQSHRELSFRYVPDVEVITVINPVRVSTVLAALLNDIEHKVDVWQDNDTDGI